MSMGSQPPGAGEPSQGKRDGAYRILPAAGFHCLTPHFDFLAGVLGFGRGFKARVVAGAGLANGMRVLDLGCGSGLLALLLKQRYPRCGVVGIDADPHILKLARSRIARAGLDGVEFRCAPAEHTGLESASFDAALSTLTFHHLPLHAKQAAVQEVARVLRPAASFVLVDLRPLIPVRRAFTTEERRSTRMALRTNTPEVLSATFAEAGFHVEAMPAPKPWSLPFWTFALRATKPSAWA